MANLSHRIAILSSSFNQPILHSMTFCQRYTTGSSPKAPRWRDVSLPFCGITLCIRQFPYRILVAIANAALYPADGYPMVWNVCSNARCACVPDLPKPEIPECEATATNASPELLPASGYRDAPDRRVFLQSLSRNFLRLGIRGCGQLGAGFKNQAGESETQIFFYPMSGAVISTKINYAIPSVVFPSAFQRTAPLRSRILRFFLDCGIRNPPEYFPEELVQRPGGGHSRNPEVRKCPIHQPTPPNSATMRKSCLTWLFHAPLAQRNL